MGRFFEPVAVQLVLSLTGLIVLLIVARYVIGKIRPKPIQKEHMASEWLAKCGEMNSRGELTDEEFRTIKTTLTPRLQDELNDTGDKG